MKTILSEIRNFRKLVKLNEQNENDVNVALIGDELVNNLMGNDFLIIPELVSENMTIDKLISLLSKTKQQNGIDHVFLSIGLEDNFINKKNIPFLVDELKETFPNAKINIIKSIIGNDYFYGGEEVSDYKQLESNMDSFYNAFKQNGLDIIGEFNHVSDGLGMSNEKLLNIKKEISKSLFQDVTDIGVTTSVNNTLSPSFDVENVDISGDDVTDFDTIYEFLNRFEEMWKSGNVYDIKSGSSFKPDIEQIQIALNFLDDTNDLEITGKYDTDTQEAIYNFQQENRLPENGICDSETLESMFFELKIKGFDDRDLSMFLSELGMVISKVEDVFLNGTVNIVGGLDGEQKGNIDIMIDYMNNMGITNPYTQIGILSVIGKESGFIPKNEYCYDETSNSRLRTLFGNRLTEYNDKELSELKTDCPEFFDVIYGKDATDELGWDTGNSEKGDGYKYRGRGFNQVTFKSSYEKYGSMVGEDLVGNPDRLNDPSVAAKVAVAFFTDGDTSLPEFDNINDSVEYFTNKNAGGLANNQNHGSAMDQSRNFEVTP